MASKNQPDETGQTKSAEEPDLQARVDEINEQGYIGSVPDPTPNEAYSLESDDWATPESDPKAAEAVGSKRFANAAGKDGD